LTSSTDARALVDAVRRGELVQWVAGPERAAQLDEVQSLMALLEGYAEHVMDEVGAEILPELDELREGLERRRRDRSGLFRVLEKVIGLDMKMRQYEEGKRFCDAVVAKGGIEALNRAWASPESLPTAAELRAPDAWLTRTR
jgi:putative hydrolase